MPYIPVQALNHEHVRALANRVGWTDVSDQFPGEFIVYRDTDGRIHAYSNLDDARRDLILFYIIVQNSP